MSATQESHRLRRQENIPLLQGVKAYFEQLIQEVMAVTYPDANISNQKLPEHLAPDIMMLGQTPQTFVHLLEVSAACLPPHTPDSLTPEAVGQVFRETLEGKNIFFLPGRTGQIPLTAMSRWRANVGVVTDDRYMPGTLSLLAHGRLGEDATALDPAQSPQLSCLLQGSVTDALWMLAPYREDIAGLIGETPPPPNISTLHCHPQRSQPDYVISTNMLNALRFSNNGDRHQMGLSWQATLARILAIGVPGRTTHIITPAFEHQPVCDKSQIRRFLTQIPGAQVHFYNQAQHDPGGYTSAADFTFSVRLQQKVPKALLSL